MNMNKDSDATILGRRIAVGLSMLGFWIFLGMLAMAVAEIASAPWARF